MKKDKMENKTQSSRPGKNDAVPGYPIYPPDDDIYSKYKEEDLDPDLNTRKHKESHGKLNEKDFSDDMTGGDLDIPGSELDDEQNDIGNEDEENDYYSLGGDDHDDLEEDNGD
jgi:hypothetical protein